MTLDPAFLLEQILSEKAVRMAFQPIVDLSDGSVFGYEALARGKGALDDFGAGNSVLRILMECCPAFLKLDRGIIFQPPSGFSAWFRQRTPKVEIPLN